MNCFAMDVGIDATSFACLELTCAKCRTFYANWERRPRYIRDRLAWYDLFDDWHAILALVVEFAIFISFASGDACY